MPNRKTLYKIINTYKCFWPHNSDNKATTCKQIHEYQIYAFKKEAIFICFIRFSTVFLFYFFFFLLFFLFSLSYFALFWYSLFMNVTFQRTSILKVKGKKKAKWKTVFALRLVVCVRKKNLKRIILPFIYT